MALTKVANTLLDFTGGFVAGNVSFPAITTVGDTNTGIYFPAADTIAFAEGGVEAARFDSSGRFGIGTTTPTTKLNVSSAGADVEVRASTTTSGNVRFGFDADGAYYNWIQTNRSSGAIQFAISNSEVMRLDASGNLGIGTSSPSAKLQVDASNFALAALYNTLSSNFAVRTTTTQAANVGGEIALGGCTNGTSSIGDFARIHGKKENGTAGNVSGYLAFEVSSDGGPSPYMFERARINSSGSLLVGTTSNSSSSRFKVVADGTYVNSEFYQPSTGSYTSIVFTNPSGTAGSITTAALTTTYSTTSDYRLKENVAPMVGALDTIAQLKPVTYTWKVDGSDGQGFIAHELQSVVPDCVTGEKDAVETRRYEISPAVPATFDENGNELTPAVEAVMGEREVPKYQGIDTSFLVATLTAAIQEQQALITQLQADVAALKGATP